jgi:hypothetical protein
VRLTPSFSSPSDLRTFQAAIERSKALLEEQIKKLREGKTEEFLKELRAKERELEGLIKKAQVRPSPTNWNPSPQSHLPSSSLTHMHMHMHMHMHSPRFTRRLCAPRRRRRKATCRVPNVSERWKTSSAR